MTRRKLLDPRPQPGLLRYWLSRSAIGAVLLTTLLIAVMGGRDDWAIVIIGMAVVACCAVLIVRGLVRHDLLGLDLVDDW
jgi:hypothetical protein